MPLQVTFHTQGVPWLFLVVSSTLRRTCTVSTYTNAIF